MNNEKDNRGGPRTAGPGKAMGRPPVPDSEKRKKYSVVLSPGMKDLADRVTQEKGYRGWGYAVEEALTLLAKEMGIE